MQILRDDQVPTLPEEQTLRETAWGDLASASAFAVLAAAFVWLPYSPWGYEVVGWVCWGLAALFAGIAWLGFNGFRGSRDPKGWKLRWLADGLYVRYRSFRNRSFPPATPSVVYLPRREIAAIRPGRLTLVTIDSEGDRAHWRRSGLQIELDGVDTAPLARALADEARQRGPRGGRYKHQPVTLGRDGSLWVEARRNTRLLDALARHFQVASEQPEALRDPARMTSAEQQDHILDLLLAGDRMGAIRMARRLNGGSLAEAKALVESLADR